MNIVITYNTAGVSVCLRPLNHPNTLMTPRHGGRANQTDYRRKKASALTAVPCLLHRRRSSWTGRSCTLCCAASLLWLTATWRSTSWSPSCTWPSGSCAPSLGLCRGRRCCASGTCFFVRVRSCKKHRKCIKSSFCWDATLVEMTSVLNLCRCISRRTEAHRTAVNSKWILHNPTACVACITCKCLENTAVKYRIADVDHAWSRLYCWTHGSSI